MSNHDWRAIDGGKDQCSLCSTFRQRGPIPSDEYRYQLANGTFQNAEPDCRLEVVKQVMES